MVGIVDKKVKYNVDKFYYENHRVTTTEQTEENFPQGEHGLKLYQHKDDEGNVIYTNDKGEYVSSHLEALNIPTKKQLTRDYKSKPILLNG